MTPTSKLPVATNETAMAIAGSFVIAIVGATIVMGNPVSAFAAAYTDHRSPAAKTAPAPVATPAKS